LSWEGPSSLNSPFGHVHKDIFQTLGLAGEFDDLEATVDDLPEQRRLLGRSAGMGEHYLSIAVVDVAYIVAGPQVVQHPVDVFQHSQPDLAPRLGLIADFVDGADRQQLALFDDS